MIPRTAGLVAVLVLVPSACAPSFLSRPIAPESMPSVETTNLEFDRYGGREGILRLAETAFAATGLLVDPERSGEGRLVSLPAPLPAAGDVAPRTVVITVTVAPRDGLQHVSVAGTSPGDYAAATAGDQRLLDAVQRVAHHLQGRIGGR